MYRASDNPQRSCGLPKGRDRPCHIPHLTGKGSLGLDGVFAAVDRMRSRLLHPVAVARSEVICNARCERAGLLFTSRVLKAERVLLHCQGSGVSFHAERSGFS